MLKKLIRPILLAGLLSAAGCQGDPLRYQEGTPGDLADRIERFADALEAQCGTAGIDDEAGALYAETFDRFFDEAVACRKELSTEEIRRIAESAGRISGVALKHSAGKINRLIKEGVQVLPGFFNELKNSLSDSEELRELQEMLQQKSAELQ